MSRQLPPCDHDDCPLSKCLRGANGEARGSLAATTSSAHSHEFQGRGTGKRTLPNCGCGRIIRRGVVCEKCGCAHCYKCTLTIKGHKVCVACAPNDPSSATPLRGPVSAPDVLERSEDVARGSSGARG